jgi:hypothetical protein
MNTPAATILDPADRLANDLRFPIGRYSPPAVISPEQRAAWIAELEALPGNLAHAAKGLNDDQLNTPYRPGGWTVRQVVHHIPDSHLNSYTRFRLALTEDSPTIKPYEEAAWAELPDAKSAPIEPSLLLADGLHRRWVMLLRTLTGEEFKRTFVHPEHGEVKLDWTLGLYAWHCRHHVAHIAGLRKRQGW